MCIYVLHFRDGMHYVGKSKDVSRRYVEHRRTYSDIVQLSFKTVRETHLDTQERRIRNLLQDHGHTLRGVVGIHPLPGEADLDLIMPGEAQQRWLDDLSAVDRSGSRMQNPALRKTHEAKHLRLARRAWYQDAIDVLRMYVGLGIPRARATEESFWSLSCLPSTSVYARININWQEVFAIYERPDGLAFGFQLALSPLRRHDVIRDYFAQLPHVPFSVALTTNGVDIAWFYDEHEAAVQSAAHSGRLDLGDETYEAIAHYTGVDTGTSISSYRYVPGGDDQIAFVVTGKEPALAFLEDQTITSAIRRFNLRLMRLGLCRYKNSHCLSLADLLVEDS
jgi:hypothetical protein